MNLTQPTERFDTLAEAEDTLKHQGFKLVADTCNWLDEAGRIDAGVYSVEDTSKFRIEYRTLKGAPTSTPMPDTIKAWAAWHPTKGFDAYHYEGAIAFADIDEALLEDVADLNETDGTDQLTGWRVVQVEIRRLP